MPSDAIRHALDRLLAEDSWEQPAVEAASAELAALEGDNETLRAALEEIASQPRATKARKMEIARRALAARSLGAV